MQYSVFDTLSNYIFYFGPPGTHLYLSPQNLLHVDGRSRPTCSRCSSFLIDVYLEVQDKRYSKILYLVDYIAYGLHLLYKI